MYIKYTLKKEQVAKYGVRIQIALQFGLQNHTSWCLDVIIIVIGLVVPRYIQDISLGTVHDYKIFILSKRSISGFLSHRLYILVKSSKNLQVHANDTKSSKIDLKFSKNGEFNLYQFRELKIAVECFD